MTNKAEIESLFTQFMIHGEKNKESFFLLQLQCFELCLNFKTKNEIK